jgi:hypothetical protein
MPDTLNKRLEKLEKRKAPDTFKIVWSFGDIVEIDGVQMTRAEYEKQRDPNARVIKLDWD